jgi:hypothetical protein
MLTKISWNTLRETYLKSESPILVVMADAASELTMEGVLDEVACLFEDSVKIFRIEQEQSDRPGIPATTVRPAFLLFKNQEIVQQVTGARTKQELVDLVYPYVARSASQPARDGRGRVSLGSSELSAEGARDPVRAEAPLLSEYDRARLGIMTILDIMLGINVLLIGLAVVQSFVYPNEPLGRSVSITIASAKEGITPGSVLPLAMIWFTWGLGFALFLVPILLARKQIPHGRRTWAVVAGLVELLLIPIGTVFGAILLMRLSGKHMRRKT